MSNEVTDLEFFQIGMRINIEIEIGGERTPLPSKIEDISGEHLIVSAPMKGINVVPIGLNEVIYIFFSKKGTFYCVSCEVIEKKYDPIPLVLIKPLKFIYKNQRSFFRVLVTLPVQVFLTEDDVTQGYISDLSGGGALLSLGSEIKIGTQVRFNIPISHKGVDVMARVVRSEKLEARALFPHRIATEFVEIGEGDRDEIIKYLLREQRLLRKRGLI